MDRQMEEFIKEQVNYYRKNTPNAHKQKIPDHFKKQMSEMQEKIERFKSSSKYKDLVKEYSQKLAHLKKQYPQK